MRLLIWCVLNIQRSNKTYHLSEKGKHILDNYIRKAIILNVVDGDTYDCEVDLGYKMKTIQRFRLLGIDTPERGEQGYNEAKDFVKQYVNHEVCVKSYKSDSFGRYLAEVHIDGEYLTLNEILIEKGYAVRYQK